MADSTPNLNLYLPGGGSSGTITPDETADIDPLVENFRKIDTAVGDPDNQNRQWTGPASSIGTIPVSPKDGDTYQETDGSKILFERIGGLWVPVGTYASLYRPTAQSLAAGVPTDVSFTAQGAQKGFAPVLPAVSLVTPVAGDYQISASIVVSQTGANFANLGLFIDGVQVRSVTGSVFPHTNAYSQCTITPLIRTIAAAKPIKLVALASSAGNIEADSAVLTVERLR